MSSKEYRPSEWDPEVTEAFYNLLAEDADMAFLETAVEGMLELNDPAPVVAAPPAPVSEAGAPNLSPEMLAQDNLRLTDVDGDTMTARYFTPDRNQRGTGAFVYFQPHLTGVIVNTTHLPNLIAWLTDQERKGREA